MMHGHLARPGATVGVLAALTLVASACADVGSAATRSVTASGAVAEGAASSATPITETGGPTTASSSTADPSVCGYYYEWLSSWRFPLQPDPHAAYSYVMPSITSDPVAFEVTGELPRAPWTSWMVYSDAASGAKPVSLVKGADIVPEAEVINPFVPGNRVLAPQRSFRLLVLPQGVEQSAIALSLQDVPAANVLTSPTDGSYFIIANRVYNAYPGYNRGGAGGVEGTPFPAVRAVNYETGEPVDCSGLNQAPHPAAPTDMPSEAAATAEPSAAVVLEDGHPVPVGPTGSGGNTGAEYAPQLDPTLIEFTRPPLLPGADVSSIPPTDNCAGYLGAATSTSEIGLIRMPHVASWFRTDELTPASLFEQRETTYISFTQYGSAVGEYKPGSPDTASLANGELLVDDSGGTTIVVWPRSLTASQQEQVFAHAGQQGWALLRGDEEGSVTSANLFVRLKGADPSYAGGYAPTADVPGVPCYFDDNSDATNWSDVVGDTYVASGANIGAGAPQGVNCTVEAFLDDSCLETLKSYITQTGGQYEAS
jgi:hypothetical protein